MIDRMPLNVVADGAIRHDIYDAAGNFLRTEYIKRNDGATVTGTPLNKANLLADDVATAFGLTAEAVPNDILKSLAKRFGTCNTSASTANKTVTIDGFVPYFGAIIAVRFTYGNTAGGVTLNVNGSGAWAVTVNSAGLSSGQLLSNSIGFFVCGGTSWSLINPVIPTGTTPIANGGTGGTTAAAALYNLVNALSAVTPATDDKIPFLDTSGSTAGYVLFSGLLAALGGKKIAVGSASRNAYVNVGFNPTMVLIHYIGGNSSYAVYGTLLMDSGGYEANYSFYYNTSTGHARGDTGTTTISGSGFTLIGPGCSNEYGDTGRYIAFG